MESRSPKMKTRCITPPRKAAGVPNACMSWPLFSVMLINSDKRISAEGIKIMTITKVFILHAPKSIERKVCVFPRTLSPFTSAVVMATVNKSDLILIAHLFCRIRG